MTSIAKLKDRARKHEQKEDWKAAIGVYQQVLDAEEGEDDLELELGLYNRIGDLYLRLGNVDDAVSYYEQAADKYAASGFINNAIALCNKALRHRPDQPHLYLKLSGLCLEQGFSTDARRWILEYAEEEVRAGNVDAALTALAEFVETAGDPAVREHLARLLAGNGRQEEAVDQLALAYGERTERGERDAADKLEQAAREIDPSVDLEAAAARLVGQESDGETWASAPTPSGERAAGSALASEVSDEEEVGGPGQDEGDSDLSAGDDFGTEEGEDEPVSGGLEGLELSYSERGPAAVADEDLDDGTLGGLETFGTLDTGAAEETEPAGAGVDPVPDPEDDLDLDEEDPEPLPLLDTGYDLDEPDGFGVTPVDEEQDVAGSEDQAVDADALDWDQDLGEIPQAAEWDQDAEATSDAAEADTGDWPPLEPVDDPALAEASEPDATTDLDTTADLETTEDETVEPTTPGEAVESDEAVEYDGAIEPDGAIESDEDIEPAELSVSEDTEAPWDAEPAEAGSDADAEDAGDHYDLGLAFKEMGLVDEAIGEFQKALTGGEERLKVYEELGQCFMQKREYTVAVKILNRALDVPHQEPSELLGVHYHLGQCHEELGDRDAARAAYEKVLEIDPAFQDVPARLAGL